jgi:hypothetical protein
MNPMSHAKTILSPQSYLAAFVFIVFMVAAAYGLNDREIILPEMGGYGRWTVGLSR